MPSATECVPVPSSEHVAEIVGRQGCKIKALRAKTNTYIKTPVRGEDSVFIVTGRQEDVESAKQEILSAAEHFTQIRASRRHSQGGIPAPGHITAYVRVPYKFVGLVVGPKGATIKRIQQQTHTYIITPSRDKEPVFEVTGISENVEAARYEIEMHIGSRTGHILPPGGSFDSAQALNDFHLNGTETSCPVDLAVGDSVAMATSAVVAQTVQVPGNVICKPVQMMQQNHINTSSNHVHHNGHLQPQQQRGNLSPLSHDSCCNALAHLSLCDSSNNSYNSVGSLVHNSQVNFGYNSWTSNIKGLSTMNSSGSDQDEGVWSTGGESPNSLSVEPLVPSCLSSIWSDLEDPKDVGVLQKRSASISVVDSTESQGGAWFRAVGNQMMPTSWPSSINLPSAAQRMNGLSAAAIGGASSPSSSGFGNGGGSSTANSGTNGPTTTVPAGLLYRRATAPIVRGFQAIHQHQGAPHSSNHGAGNAGNSAPGCSLAAASSCHVCQAAPAQAQLMPCNHRCFCYVCATRLRQMPKPVCPICQAPIAGTVRLA